MNRLANRLWYHLGGLLLDGLGFAVGLVGSFIACWAWYEGTLGQFWQWRLMLSPLPVAMVAWLSTGLRSDPSWRCWLRFALFEYLTLVLIVDSAERAYGFESLVQFELALLVDAIVYWVVLKLSRTRLRAAGDAPATRREPPTHAGSSDCSCRTRAPVG